jgi:ATP-dependent RNA helicase RhlE
MPSSQLGLTNAFMQTLAKLKYGKPTLIQSQAIPVILKGKDILGIAQTGSGKTLSFVLPLLMNLDKDKTPLKNRRIKALILVPTRELAVQVSEVVEQFKNATQQKLKTLAVFGGVSIQPQMIALQNVHILIATPGRLLDLVEKQAVLLSDVKMLVMDEADKMLNRSFEKELSQILTLLPKKRQNLLFSATLTQEVTEVEKLILDEPILLKIEAESNAIDLINQSAYLVTDEKKGPLLRYLIKTKQYQQSLVFVSSTLQADKVVNKLNKNGVNAVAIHSKKTQSARTSTLAKFKTGELQVLVTTDLLSRGIDIEFLPCVINYDLPRSPKDFIHRIGRTGRASASGDAISFLREEDLPHFKVIQKKMGKWVELSYSRDINLHGF